MSLLREIQDGATDSTGRLADLLRKTKILSARLGSPQLAEWVDKELNGYAREDTLPNYRKAGPNRVTGNFAGIAGSGLENGEIPQACVDKDDVARLFHHEFVEGIAHYEELLAGGGADFAVPWPGNAVLKYASRVYQHMTMLSARQTLTAGAIYGVLDAVRTRLLDLALEIERENPDAGEAPLGGVPPVPPEIVAQHFQSIIVQGSHNTIAGAVQQQQIAYVASGPAWDELRGELLKLGFPPADVHDLHDAIESDAEEIGAQGELGPATQSWIRRAAGRAKEIGSSVSTDVLTALIVKLLGAG